MTTSRRLATEVALVNVTTTTGGTGDTGEELLVRSARGTWLLHRRAGKWLVAAMRGLPTEEDRVELVSSLETAQRIRPQVRAFVASYEDAFNLHDADALSAFFREDADIVVREQPMAHGEQIRSMWQAYFRQPRPYRALLIVEEIRMVSDDVALVNVTGAGAPLEASRKLAPTRSTRATWVLVRGEAGEWLLAALRVMPSEEDRVVHGSR